MELQQTVVADKLVVQQVERIAQQVVAVVHKLVVQALVVGIAVLLQLQRRGLLLLKLLLLSG
jgi:hypothetical protein